MRLQLLMFIFYVLCSLTTYAREDDYSVSMNNTPYNMPESSAALPGKPTIENIQFDIIYDWNNEYPQPKESLFVIDVYYYNTESLLLFSTCNGQYHTSEKPSILNCIIDSQETSDSKSGVVHFEIPDTDWGECFAVSAYNKYGITWSDTINTSDYIRDPVLIEYINDYWNKQSGISDIKLEKDCIIVRDDKIICKPEIQSLSIYSLSGIAVKRFYYPEIIAIDDLPKGIYFITYTTDSYISKSIKFLKP